MAGLDKREVVKDRDGKNGRMLHKKDNKAHGLRGVYSALTRFCFIAMAKEDMCFFQI
jgi:hypothetical protein